MLALIDKPTWYTSFDIIRKLKRIYPDMKIWHSWTLDPMATWLLVIWIWKDTKKLCEIQQYDKEYVAHIDFSYSTDTWDMDFFEVIKNYELKTNNWVNDGIIIDWNIIKAPSLEQIKEKLDSIIPSYEMPLPSFSAKKVNWKKLYDLAREWVDLNLSRVMKIYSYEILDYSFPVLKIKINVWSWTYIRSIAYWLGKEFWIWWVLSYLRRTRIWEFDLDI